MRWKETKLNEGEKKTRREKGKKANKTYERYERSATDEAQM